MATTYHDPAERRGYLRLFYRGLAPDPPWRRSSGGAAGSSRHRSRAESTMIGTVVHSRMRRMISRPSRSGNPRSRMMTSGWRVRLPTCWPRLTRSTTIAPVMEPPVSTLP